MRSRRDFLRQCAALAVAGCVGGPAWAARLSPRAAPRRLIMLYQRGAADALSMVVPHGDGAYYAARPNIALAPPRHADHDAVRDLDGHFGLHPRLAPLVPLWREGRLAVLHAVGSPDGTRSHFDAQDYLETATPGVKGTTDGWLNRYLASAAAGDATPLRAVALSHRLPRVLQGAQPTLAVGDLARFGVRGGTQLRSALAQAYAGSGDALLADTSRAAFAALDLLEARHLERAAGGGGYPDSAFGRALSQLALLVKGDVGLELGYAETLGWDTHVEQGAARGTLAERLDDFGTALMAFVADLGAEMERTVILTQSEFGRTVAENGGRGTDHGHGSVMFALGGGIAGGRVLGRWPGLGPAELFEGRDLAVTTDFRDALGEVVARHLRAADGATLFPGHGIDAARFPGLWPVARRA